MQLINSQITSGFWQRWQQVNAHTAIFHQWEQLEKSGCIDNFRILAEGKTVPRRGWFFADSDAYKWLEAAALIQKRLPSSKLDQLMQAFIDLLQRAQEPDGYLYTFNQIHFPGTRWVNLQIEHELYCHGHLIEAGVSHFLSFGTSDLLEIAVRAADRIVTDFMGKGPCFTPGHQEIEIALLRLFSVTEKQVYRDMAAQFVAMRGRQRFFALQMIRQFITNNQRVAQSRQQNLAISEKQGEPEIDLLSPGNPAKKPVGVKARFFANALTGRLFQQHRPLIKQSAPVGHSVRFVYLQTAAAMLDLCIGEENYRPTLERLWKRMVSRRMYLTGGIGSLPEIEGFGRDHELDPTFAYAETCAALGSLFWNRAMTALTREACYSDLFEWQLYNAALVGMGQNGKAYFYNNPLTSRGEVRRQVWFEVPCCPSNLSRTVAALEKDILFSHGDTLFIGQYFSSTHQLLIGDEEVGLEIDSQLPWKGRVKIRLQLAQEKFFQLRLRHPSWASGMTLRVNDEPQQSWVTPRGPKLNPWDAAWVEVSRNWQDGDELDITFEMPVRLMRADQQVRSVRGMAAVTCGPLVYCLESCDNPKVDIFEVIVDPDSLQLTFSPELLGGTNLVRGKSVQSQPLAFVPYHLWGNRGASQMTVFCRV